MTSCKHSGKDTVQRNWTSFPHPWSRWKHYWQAVLCPQILSAIPGSASSPHHRGLFLTLISSVSLEGTPADLLKKMAWYNLRKAFLSKCKPCGNLPGQKLFLEAIKLLKLDFLLKAVSQLTSCVWKYKLSNWRSWGNIFHTFLAHRASRVY